MARQTLWVAAAAVIGISGCASEPQRGPTAGSGGPSASRASASATPMVGGHSCPSRFRPTPDAHGDVHDVMVDYVDALRFDGREYLSMDSTPVKQTDLGAGVGRIACTLSGPTQIDPAYRLQDGDATFVPVGTTIYAVKGAPPDQELAAEHDGAMHLYKVRPPR